MVEDSSSNQKSSSAGEDLAVNLQNQLTIEDNEEAERAAWDAK